MKIYAAVCAACNAKTKSVEGIATCRNRSETIKA